MPDFDLAALEHALDLLPNQFRGPGGVAGVVRDGQIIARRAWGYADLGARREMTAQTRLPICSISKQMTCALLLDQCGDPARLDGALAALLPELEGPMPHVAHLCHNQSGLRDYWAMTVLEGAYPEGLFTRDDGLSLLMRARRTQFTPGESYSYCNGNFRLLAELIARDTGRDFGDLLAERIFAPAGMTTATLHPDTRTPIDGVVGYEGNDAMGFLPAKCGIYWFGDAGISASLDDMLAWERHIDATRHDPESLYGRISGPVTFADGSPAGYGYGLRHESLPLYDKTGQLIATLEGTGHGGALRGFSSYRIHLAAERLSLVVIFNHESGAIRAVGKLIAAAFGASLTPPAQAAPNGNKDWDGLWFDAAQGLFIRTTATQSGVQLSYLSGAQSLNIGPEAEAFAPGLQLKREAGGLMMRREMENSQILAPALSPLALADGGEISGHYLCDETGATLEITSRDGGSYVVFTGALGTGPAERCYPLAQDLWSVVSRRSMDAAPPGEWTVQITRDTAGKVEGLVIGCWLARKIAYRRLA